MSKQNTSSKGFAPWRWLKRMFFGSSKEYTLADERYDSPGKLAVKRFFIYTDTHGRKFKSDIQYRVVNENVAVQFPVVIVRGTSVVAFTIA